MSRRLIGFIQQLLGDEAMRAIFGFATGALLVSGLMLSAASPANAKRGAFTVLYNFTGGTDGGTPAGDLLLDEQGTLYGTTVHGGTGRLGVAFKLSQTG